MDKEAHNQLPFLVTRVYRKKTFTGSLTYFEYLMTARLYYANHLLPEVLSF